MGWVAWVLRPGVPAAEDTGLPWRDPVGDIRREDSHKPCAEEDTRDTVDIQGRADILPCAEAFHRVLLRNHAAEADTPEGESPRPPEEIHRDTRGVEEEDTRTEAAVLPAYTEACVRPDDHRRAVVVDDVEEDGVADAPVYHAAEVDELLEEDLAAWFPLLEA